MLALGVRDECDVLMCEGLVREESCVGGCDGECFSTSTSGDDFDQTSRGVWVADPSVLMEDAGHQGLAYFAGLDRVGMCRVKGVGRVEG